MHQPRSLSNITAKSLCTILPQECVDKIAGACYRPVAYVISGQAALKDEAELREWVSWEIHCGEVDTELLSCPAKGMSVQELRVCVSALVCEMDTAQPMDKVYVLHRFNERQQDISIASNNKEVIKRCCRMYSDQEVWTDPEWFTQRTEVAVYCIESLRDPDDETEYPVYYSSSEFCDTQH